MEHEVEINGCLTIPEDAEDDDVLASSQKLMARNRHVYEELAK